MDGVFISLSKGVKLLNFSGYGKKDLLKKSKYDFLLLSVYESKPLIQPDHHETPAHPADPADRP
jgi:hypothetical protein